MRALLIGLFALSLQLMQAQVTLEGQVIDSENSRPLEEVLLEIYQDSILLSKFYRNRL